MAVSEEEQTRCKAPRVSVVITTYNRADKSAAAIRSVLEQTYDNFDIWVIDDGSTDSTPEMVRSFDSPRLHYIQKANGGLSSARNAGIRASHGDYIAFLDDDDVCLDHRLATQAAFLDRHPDVGVLFSDVWKVDTTGRRWRFTETVPEFSRMFRENRAQNEYVLSASEFLRSILVELPLKPSAVMMRRECFDKVGYFDERLGPGEMLDLVLRLTRAGTTFAYHDEPVVDYHVWGGNIGVGSRTKAPRYAIKILEENRRLARLNGAEGFWARSGIAFQFYLLGDTLYEDGQRAESCVAFLNAFRRERKALYLARAAACWMPEFLIRAAKSFRRRRLNPGPQLP